MDWGISVSRWLAKPQLAERAPTFAQQGCGVAAYARFASEGWWVMQESNLRPAD